MAWGNRIGDVLKDGMENASGLGGKECILYTQEFGGMSCGLFLGRKTVASNNFKICHVKICQLLLFHLCP